MTNFNDLSERETEILKLVATGVSNKEIARVLNISTNTVKVHVRNIFTKIGVLSRTEATLFAIEHHIVDSPGNPEEPTNREAIASEQSKPKIRWLYIAAIVVILAGIVTGGFLLSPLSPIVTPTAQNSNPDLFLLSRWQEMAPLPEGRAGMASSIYENQIYVFSGKVSSGITNSSLRYDVASDSWHVVSDKPTPVSDIEAASLGEKIYIPGGWNGEDVINKMEVYDPRNNKWEVKAPLPQPRSGYAMTSLEGRLYLFGGWDGEKVTDTIFSYDPINDEWSEMSSMPVAIAYMDAVTVGSKIYIAGGWNESTSIDSLYIYIPNREISLEYPWDKQSLQITPSCPIRISTIANSIFLLGGSQTCKQPFLNFREDSSVFYQYQTLTNEWILIDSPKFISSSPAIIAYGDYLFIFGGYASDGYSAKNVSYQAVFTTTIPVIINGQ